ncbi:malate dehydrogenase [Microbacterium sp. A93]|uniref:malate dehydrogenase n=1 Tax=Microbacterium sp. A93 TaxID=3450716 RepID=UPI003F43F20D
MNRTLAPAWPATVSIIGAAGLVGSSGAASLATHGIGRDLYLQDRRENIVQAHRIDLTDAQAVLGLDLPQIHAGAPDGPVDLVVVAASMPETPDGDRREFLAANAKLLGSLAEQILREAGDHGLILLLTNPVDILATWLHRTHGFPADRLIGYSLNDSARFRLAVARELGVKTSSLEAAVFGEHGTGQVPAFSTVRVDGEPVAWPDGAVDRVRADVDGWFERWSRLKPGRSSGWATGAGVMQLIRTLAAGEEVITTVTTSGIGDLPDVFMALPTRLLEGRTRATLPELTEGELTALQTSGDSILQSALTVG